MQNLYTRIRVGQRLRFHDGTKGYVALGSKYGDAHGPKDSFLVQRLDSNGKKTDAEWRTLEDFEREGITFGRGMMPWAR